MLGRNELCPCGSGKKYKKCCLNKDTVVERASRKISLSQNQYADLWSKLYEYSRQDKFKEEYEKAKEMFYIVEDENINNKFNRFFYTYFIQDHIMENKKVMTVEFFEEKRESLNKLEVEILRSLFESYVSVYEVKEVSTGSVKIKDCLTGKEIETEDVKLLKDFTVGDSMIARVVSVEETNLLIDITISITEEIKDVVVTEIMNLFNQYEDLYKDVKTFLIHHTHILYKYMQQLLEPSISDYLKKQKELKEEKATKCSLGNDADDCKIACAIRQNADDEDLDACLEFWNEYKNIHGEVKGSENGWAAAIEYHIKKANGKNVTQSQISKKYDISPSTLGKRYKDLKVS